MFQVTDIQLPQTPTFEQARPQLEEQFRNQAAQRLLAQKTQQMADRARTQHDLRAAAKEVGATVKTSDMVDPSAQVPELGQMSGSVSVAFGMKTGEISGPLQSGGNGVVLAILAKQEPSPEEVKKNWDKAKETVLQQKRNAYEALYVQNLRDQPVEKEKAKSRSTRKRWSVWQISRKVPSSGLLGPAVSPLACLSTKNAAQDAHLRQPLSTPALHPRGAHACTAFIRHSHASHVAAVARWSG